jgi:formylmethanofuran dehydrogenase subunit E
MELDVALSIMKDAGFSPIGEFGGSKKPWLSICDICGKESSPQVSSVIKGHKCKYCAHEAQGLIKRKYSEANAREIFSQSNLLPIVPFPGTTIDKWVSVHLPCGSEVQPSLKKVLSGQIGCKTCQYNDMRIDDPAELFDSLEISPLTKFETTGKAMKFKCDRCGNVFSAHLHNLGGKRRGCRPCSIDEFKRIPVEEILNNFKSANLLILESLDLDLSKKLSVACMKCEYRFKMSPQLLRDKRKVGNGCPKCHGMAISNRLRLSEKEAVASLLEQNIEPLEPYPGLSTVSWLCRCLKCGSDLDFKLTTARQGSGCRYCNITGMKRTDPALVYLITNSSLLAVKIGIAKVGSDRIQEHVRNGWEVHHLWSEINVEVAYEIEKVILKSWRDSGVPVAVLAEEMPQKGHTETAPSYMVELREVVSIGEKAKRDILKKPLSKQL